MTDPYENLANAIVLQAVKDYRDALKRLKKKPGNQTAMSDAMECERFFRSGWYKAYERRRSPYDSKRISPSGLPT